ncbi:hydroxyethylthiazole kinase [Streptomyces sp. NPDC004629]|uniref:hydroxyethylthiazole kinase n=1 Tax=Streptomyces sp. NPDC004629 TaxID=3364705 RepID=UPI00369E0653
MAGAAGDRLRRGDGIAAIRSGSPFVHGLTNHVAANLSANVLLAVVAGPATPRTPPWYCSR